MNLNKYIYSFFLLISISNWIVFSNVKFQTEQKYDEIPVVLKLKNVGSLDLIILRQNDRIYYPIKSIFNFLGIKIEFEEARKIFSGFYQDKKRLYTIDLSEKMVAKYLDIEYTIKTDDILIHREEIYFTEEFYDEIFGLELRFDLQKLSVNLKSREPVPIIIKNRAKINREKIINSRVASIEPKPEKYQYKLYNGSALDWRISSNLTKKKIPNYRYYLGSGSRILGSDLQFTVRGDVHQPIKNKDINGSLRTPFWMGSTLGQITLGDLNVLSPNRLGRVRGIEITNRPARRRILQGSDEIKLKIDDSEVLEVYQSGMLNSFYPLQIDNTYKVPLVLPYGISDYEFRSYDQWGGYDKLFYRYYIPYNLLPDGEFQYSVRTGYMRSRMNEQYGNVVLEYGATNLITLGAELQYLNSKNNTKLFPAGLATVRLTKGVTGEFSFSPFLRSVSKLIAHFPSETYLSLSHEFYNKNSPLNYGNIEHQAIANLRLPILTSKGMRPSGVFYEMNSMYSKSVTNKLFSFFSQFYAYAGEFQLILGSRYYKNIYQSVFSTTTSHWSTNVNMSYRLPLDVVFQTSSNYNHTQNRIENVGVSLTKGVRNFYFTASYERVLSPNITIANLNLSYYLPFVRSTSNINRVQGKMSYNQTFQGSIVTSSNFKNYFFNNRLMLGRGVIEVKPYFDANNNGVKEKEENYIQNIKINQSSKMQKSYGKKTKDGLLIGYAEPYQTYTAVIPHQPLENPNWVAKYQSVSTIAEPNAYKIIELPFVNGGTVSGTVTIVVGDSKEPVSGITVVVTQLTDQPDDVPYSNKTFTMSSGEYFFENIPPGKYRVTLLESELAVAGYVSIINEHLIEVYSQPEGHIIENIDFGLIKIE